MSLTARSVIAERVEMALSALQRNVLRGTRPHARRMASTLLKRSTQQTRAATSPHVVRTPLGHGSHSQTTMAPSVTELACCR